MATIVYIVGVIASIWCVLDILKKKCNILMKLLLIFGVLVTSWIGFLVYYFIIRNSIK